MDKQLNVFDYLGDTVLKKRGIVKDRVFTETISTSILKDYPIFILFFSANWCPPCKGMVPCLKRFYEEVNEKEYNLSKTAMSEYTPLTSNTPMTLGP
jgi:thiol-disulfide isomerase/thioredoxin